MANERSKHLLQTCKARIHNRLPMLPCINHPLCPVYGSDKTKFHFLGIRYHDITTHEIRS